MENRGVPQGPEVGLQGRRLQPASRRTPRQSDGGILHTELAGALADHAESNRAGGPAGNGLASNEISLLDHLVSDTGNTNATTFSRSAVS